MRAMVLREHGGLDKLTFDPNFPDPDIGPADVLLRVRATSLNYHDIFTRRGMPGIKIPLPVIMGLDVAGEIVKVGSDVKGWKAGDRVLVDPLNRVEGGLMGETMNGGLAELCKARAHQLVRIPDNVSFEQAAALPVAYGTAHRMMTTNGQVSAGEKVLVLGASGGVGVCCVQLAKIAARCMVGQSLDSQGIKSEVVPPYYSVKEAVFPFVKFPGVDTILGPEMKSTGEVMGVGKTFGEAFVKSQMGAGVKLPKSGKVFLSVKNSDKPRAVQVARDLVALGFSVVATKGTAAAINAAGIPAICFGPGDISLAHAAEEYVPMDEIERATRVLTRLAHDWCNGAVARWRS